MVPRTRLWARGVMLLGLGILGLWGSGDAAAAEVDINPQLTVALTATDNLELEPPGDEQADLVLQVEPSIAATYNTGRLAAEGRYGLRLVLPFVHPDESNVEQNLLLRAEAELLAERLFLQGDAGIDQRIEDDDDDAIRNDLSLTGDRVTVYTAGLRPRGEFALGDVADATLEHESRVVFFDGGDTEDQFNNRFSAALVNDAVTDRWGLALTGGYRIDRRFGDEVDEGDGKVRTEAQVEGATNYRLRENFELLARAGYLNENPFTDEDDVDVENGGYASGGFAWGVWPDLTVGVLLGFNENEQRLRYVPTSRLRLEVVRLERDVGTDPGVRWQGELAFEGRRLTVAANYREEVTDSQTTVGASVVDPEGGGDFFIPDSLGVTSEEFLERRLDLTVRYEWPKTTLDLRGGVEFREFLDNSIDGDEERYSFQGLISRRLGPQTTVSLEGAVLERREDRGDDDSSWGLRLSLQRAFTPTWEGAVRYSHSVRNSDDPDDDFRENRLTLQTTLAF